MISLNRWQAAPALVLSFGLVSSTIAPLVPTAATANQAQYKVAQLFPSQQSQYPSQYNRVAIPAGTRIPVGYDKDKVIVSPEETSDLTLTVSRNIRSTSGTLLIGAGSQVKGKLRPAYGGTQFIAEELTLTDGTKLPLNASSQVITRTEEVRRGVSTDALLKGAAIGAGASTIISGLAGNRRITVGKVLIGAGAGALGGLLLGRNTAKVVVVNPNTDLTLTLNSSLALR